MPLPAKPSHQWSSCSEYAGHYWRQKYKNDHPEISDAEKCRQYKTDPVGFARDILGIETWSRQREIFEAIVNHRRVSVVSGHRVGKSYTIDILALWFYCNYPEARVTITAPSEDKINDTFWRTMGELIRRAKNVMGITIPGSETFHLSARGGMQDKATGATIKGLSVKKSEVIAGLAGENQLFLVDEASGVDDAVYEAMSGNMAAQGSFLLLIGNPVKASGVFYESQTSRQKTEHNPYGYYAMHIDTNESPNITGEWRQMHELIDGEWRPRTEPVSGLADIEYVEIQAADYGRESAEFQVRVSGKFVAAEEKMLFPPGSVSEAVERWESDEVEATGRLYIGVDPAGSGVGGDNSAFAVRRGQKLLEIVTSNGLNPAGHVAFVEGLIQQHQPRGSKLKPAVVVDGEGTIGINVVQALRANAYTTNEYIVVNVLTSKPAYNQRMYDFRRTELWVGASKWLRGGGAIPRVRALLQELQVPQLIARDMTYHGWGEVSTVTPKKEFRETLKRSPDSADAFCLSCFEPKFLIEEESGGPALAAPRPAAALDPFEGAPEAVGIDAYGGSINPYG